jgi:hypothetical protein
MSSQTAVTPGPTHGLLAQFDEPEELVRATEQAYAAGYRRMDAYSPFPVEGLADALGMRWSWVPRIMFVCGALGTLTGYFLQTLAMGVWYPINVGGRPYNSILSYIPPMFELTVLFSAISGVVAVVVLNRLPQPYHPVFNVARFARASTDGFFLCIEARDRRFDPEETARFLRSLGAREVFDVPV